MSEAKTDVVTMTVDSLHILEQVAQEADAYGIKLGTAMIHGLLQKVAVRAADIDDPELNILMLKLHLYDVPSVSESIAEQQELLSKTVKKNKEKHNGKDKNKKG